MARKYNPVKNPGDSRKIGIQVDYVTDNNIAYLLSVYEGLTVSQLIDMLVTTKAAAVRNDVRSIVPEKKNILKRAILKLKQSGKTNVTIAKELGISEAQVRRKLKP